MLLSGEKLPDLAEVDLETIFNLVKTEDLETLGCSVESSMGWKAFVQFTSHVGVGFQQATAAAPVKRIPKKIKQYLYLYK